MPLRVEMLFVLVTKAFGTQHMLKWFLNWITSAMLPLRPLSGLLITWNKSFHPLPWKTINIWRYHICVCGCVCIYICMCIYIYIYMYVHIRLHPLTWKKINIWYFRMCMCTYIYIIYFPSLSSKTVISLCSFPGINFRGKPWQLLNYSFLLHIYKACIQGSFLTSLCS